MIPTVEFRWYKRVVQVWIDGAMAGHLSRRKKGSTLFSANLSLISGLTGDPNTEELMNLPLSELQRRIQNAVAG